MLNIKLIQSDAPLIFSQLDEIYNLRTIVFVNVFMLVIGSEQATFQFTLLQTSMPGNKKKGKKEGH